MTTTTEQPQPHTPEDRPLDRIAATLEIMKENMVTKADIEALCTDMATKADIEALCADMARMRAETAKMGARILRRQFVMWIATMLMLLAIFALTLANRVGG